MAMPSHQSLCPPWLYSFAGISACWRRWRRQGTPLGGGCCRCCTGVKTPPTVLPLRCAIPLRIVLSLRLPALSLLRGHALALLSHHCLHPLPSPLPGLFRALLARRRRAHGPLARPPLPRLRADPPRGHHRTRVPTGHLGGVRAAGEGESTDGVDGAAAGAVAGPGRGQQQRGGKLGGGAGVGGATPPRRRIGVRRRQRQAYGRFGVRSPGNGRHPRNSLE